MTGKERAALRAQANNLEPLFQIGKSGVTEAVAAQMETAYNTRELVKIRVLLDSSPDMPRAAAQKLAEMTGSEIIQVIGGVVVLFRLNEELRKKEAEKKKREKMETRERKKKLFNEKNTARPGKMPLPQSTPKAEKMPLKKTAPKPKRLGKPAAKTTEKRGK